MNFRSIIFIVLVLFSYVFFRVSPLKYTIVYKPHVTTHVFEKNVTWQLGLLSEGAEWLLPSIVILSRLIILSNLCRRIPLYDF